MVCVVSGDGVVLVVMLAQIILICCTSVVCNAFPQVSVGVKKDVISVCGSTPSTLKLFDHWKEMALQ